MGFYANLERKAAVPCDFARGGEIIEVAPYLSATGYTDVGVKTNAVTSEHVSKFVKVAAGYSLEPLGKITYQESTSSDPKQSKLNDSTITVTSLNVFNNNYTGAQTGSYFAGSGATVNDLQGVENLRLFYSKLFSKAFLSIRYSDPGVTNKSCGLVDCTALNSFVFRIQYGYGSGFNYYALGLIETSTVAAIFRGDATNAYHTTSDGTTMVARTLPASMTLVGLAASTSVLMILNSSGVIYTSGDAVNWVSRGTIGYSGAGLKGLAFGNGTFANIISTSQIKTSVDSGVNWVTKNLPETLTWNAIIYNPFANVFVLIPNNKSYFYITTDFTVFTQKALPWVNTSSEVGFLGNSSSMFLGDYVSRDMFVWMKSPPLTGKPPTYNTIPNDIFYATVTGLSSTSLLSKSNGNISTTNFNTAPIFGANISSVNAFVRTALE